MGRYPLLLPYLVTLVAALGALVGASGRALGGSSGAASLATVLSAVAAGLGLQTIYWLRSLDGKLDEGSRNPGAVDPSWQGPPGARRLLMTVAALKARLDAVRTGSRSVREQVEGLPVMLTEAAEQSRTALETWTTDSSEHLHAVKRVNSSWDQVSDMAERIASQAEEVERASSQATTSCEDGGNATNVAVEEMDRVRDSVLAIADRMRSLRSVSEQVEETARAIDQVSTQINLLALNAAIEAAGAGEFGERFGVVAVEVKQLADQTVEATKMIKDLLLRIKEEVSGGIQLTERGALSVQKGYAQVRQLETLLRGIRTVVEQTDRSAKNILSSTKVQVFAVRNARKEVAGIESQLLEEGGSEHLVRSTIDTLHDALERLRRAEALLGER